MPLPHPLPELPEADATGEIGDIYQDIRDTLGLPVVNLIWRHFATIDGGLTWAWRSLRPHYVSGAVAMAGARLLHALELPTLPPIPACMLTGCGVDVTQHATLHALIQTYNRGNALNICALAALLEGKTGQVPGSLEEAPPLPRITAEVPALRPLSSFSPAVQDQVLALNELGGSADDPAVATLYRHLAPFPGFLNLAWALLAPLHGSGALQRQVGRCAALARQQAGSLGVSGEPAPESVRAPVREATVHFVGHVIARMVPVGEMLGRALAGPAPDLHSRTAGL
jgi:hypothetical protein